MMIKYPAVVILFNFFSTRFYAYERFAPSFGRRRLLESANAFGVVREIVCAGGGQKKKKKRETKMWCAHAVLVRRVIYCHVISLVPQRSPSRFDLVSYIAANGD